MSLFENFECKYSAVISSDNEFIGYEGKAILPQKKCSLLEVIAGIAENYPYKDKRCRLFINVHDFGSDCSSGFDDLEIFKIGGDKVYSVLNYIIPKVCVVFVTKFTNDYYNEDYYPANKSDIIENVIIEGIKDLIDYSYEVMLDDVGSDEFNHILSVTWEVVGYIRFCDTFTSEEALNDTSVMWVSKKNVMDYYIRQIDDFGAISFAKNVKSQEQFNKLKNHGVSFLTGEYINKIAPGSKWY